jgi:hypothetical protein
LNDGTPVPAEKALVFGAVIGLVKVVNCLTPDDPRIRDNPFAEGPRCWILDQPRPLLQPFYMNGQQGLYEVDIPDEFITGTPAAPTILPAQKPAQLAGDRRGCQVVDLPGGGSAFVCRRGSR